MADQHQPSDEHNPAALSQKMCQIRDMLSKAVRIQRTDCAGDLMPNVSLINFLNNAAFALSWFFLFTATVRP